LTAYSSVISDTVPFTDQLVEDDCGIGVREEMTLEARHPASCRYANCANRAVVKKNDPDLTPRPPFVDLQRCYFCCWLLVFAWVECSWAAFDFSAA
jgi:hypothetical protein